MILDNLWRLFNKKIFTIPSTDGLFNQYKDIDKKMDLPSASEIRRHNLHAYIKSFETQPSVVVVGEAAGPRGCRFSGVPFTSEKQLCNGILPFLGKQSSTKSNPYSENTATIFWGVMLRYYPVFFAWNCVPLHPYSHGNRLSIRTPTASEIVEFSCLLAELLSLLKPKKIIAVGRKAQLSLEQSDITCTYVRHPSQGGARKFRVAMPIIFTSLSG